MAQSKSRRADEVLLSALSCGASKEGAARQAGISVRTVHRRMSDPDFLRRLEALGAELMQRTAAALTAAGPLAVRMIVEMMQRPSAKDASRLGAARTTLEFCMRVREFVVFERRLTALEETTNQS